jgi:HEAT repeat protein
MLNWPISLAWRSLIVFGKTSTARSLLLLVLSALCLGHAARADTLEWVSWWERVGDIANLSRMLVEGPNDARKAAYTALGRLDQPLAGHIIAVVGAVPESKSAVEARRQLLGVLDDTDPRRREAAVWALMVRPNQSEVGALSIAAKDPDRRVRRAAVLGLGRIGPNHSLSSLLAAIADADGDVRLAAAQGLARSKERAAMDMLFYALGDELAAVRAAAAQGLATMGEKIGISVQRSLSEQRFALRSLARNPDSRVVPGLLRLLNHPDPILREWAAKALGAVANPAAVSGLVKLLGDRVGEVRVAAVWALEDIGDPRTAGAFLGVLDDSFAEARAGAAAGLIKVGVPAAAPGLIEALDDPFAEVRLYATQALSELGATTALDSIVERLEDPNGDVRRAAVSAIGNLGGPDAVPILEQALDDHYFEVRLAAVESLGILGDPSTVPILIGSLHDTSTSVREAAAQSLGKFEDPGASVALVEMLADPNASVREAVIDALALQGLDLGDFFRLSVVMTEPSLVEVLPKNEPLVVRALIVALAHPQHQVRQKAALALTHLKIPAAREALIEMAGGWQLSDRMVATEMLLAAGGKDAFYSLARVAVQPASLLYLCCLIGCGWLCFRFIRGGRLRFWRTHSGGSGHVV